MPQRLEVLVHALRLALEEVAHRVRESRVGHFLCLLYTSDAADE